jgi:chemotaxis protein MotB
MRRRKLSVINKDAWMNTYADMVTLILVFFVLLYAMSSLDQGKYRMLVQAFSSNPQALEQLVQKEKEKKTEGTVELDEIKDLSSLYRYLASYIVENDLSRSVQVAKGKNIVRIRFASNLFFEADQSEIKADGIRVLSQVGAALAAIEPTVAMIRIDGHTAESPPGTDEVNDRDLSTERANAVLKYLETNDIKDPAKLCAVGFGRYRPTAPNDTEANRAKNRRVEILVLKTDTVQDEIDALNNSAQ